MNVTLEEFASLKTRVHNLADQMQKFLIENAGTTARVQSAEESIDRLRITSATNDQVVSASTILSLKLDHLLEKQFDMKRQISLATKSVFFLFLCGVGVLAWVAFWK